MNEGEVQGASDEDEDIYKDIGDFRFDRELTKLEDSNRGYIEDIARLTQKLNELTERNETLQSVNEILATNISILLKTAKAEINRKQLVIDEFRKKIEVQGRRHKNERSHLQKLESLKACGNETAEDNCSKSDIEDGEIVQDDSEERIRNSDVGKPNDSSYRDRRYHSSHHRTRQKSQERLKGRSNDICSSHRKLRCPVDNYSRHSSSSRSHHRSTSPDLRVHLENRTRSGVRSRHSSRADRLHRSRSRKTEISPKRKEKPSRKSRERRRSGTRKDFEKSRKDGTADRGREEKANKPEYIEDTKTFRPKKGEKEVENKDVVKCSNVVKTLSIAEYRQKRNADANNQKTDLLVRQSVLADLYDKPAAPKISPEIPKDISKSISDGSITGAPQSDHGAAEDSNDWPGNNDWSQWKRKDTGPIKEPKTLYSRRMEARYQKQQRLEDASSEKREEICEKQKNDTNPASEHESCKKNSENGVEDEKITEEGVLTEKEDGGQSFQTQESVEADCTSKVDKEGILEPMQKTTDVDLDQSFGEALIKKLLQLQTTEENVGINEFSPLKNNYKLSKISPLKTVAKQHILEYYNLKPSTQQLNTTDPEVSEFSLSLPDTPGKNFLNSFLPLSDTEESSRREANDSSDAKCTENKSTKKENSNAADAKSGCESGIDELITVVKPSKNKKKNIKATKIINARNETCSESKKLPLTSDEEEGQGKSYKTRYQMRTRSKTENGKINQNEVEDIGKKNCGKSRNGSGEEGGLKRERRLTPTDEGDLGTEPKRIKCDTPKTENDTSVEVPADGTVPADITSFEVFRSVSDETVGDVDALVQEVTRVDDKSEDTAWNGDDSTMGRIASNETAEMTNDKGKQSLSSTGNSVDSSAFKILRGYALLSANDDTEDDPFGSDESSIGSGEYSDSGASALVDLL